MNNKRAWRELILSDAGILILMGLINFALHMLTNGQYGFHRDELSFLDDAKNLAWGYTTYPPFTPFIVRVALEIFGPTLIGLRFFSAVAMSTIMLLVGLMTRDLDGSRWSQVIAAVAAGIAPAAMALSALYMYETYDYFWLVVVAYMVMRMLKSGNPRWWLGVGAAIGLGMASWGSPFPASLPSSWLRLGWPC